jgi:hypothetical protein
MEHISKAETMPRWYLLWAEMDEHLYVANLFSTVISLEAARKHMKYLASGGQTGTP